MDLLKYDHHAPTNKFLDSLFCHMFLPRIIQPTRVASNCKTLIDNIFSNILGPSFHLSQFFIEPNIFSNSLLGSQSNFCEWDWTKFDTENFILDYLAEDKNSITKKGQANVNLSFQIFLNKINFILDKYTTSKKGFKHKLKFKSKH